MPCKLLAHGFPSPSRRGTDHHFFLHSTCIAGAVYISMIAAYDPSDSTFNALPMMLVAFVEPAAGITLGCLPVLRPLLKRNRTSVIGKAPKSAGSTGSTESHMRNNSETGQETHAITVKTSWYVQHGTDSETGLVRK